MMSEVPFSRIALGTLRGLQRTINFARKLGKDTSWTEHFSINAKWGKKYSDGQGRAMLPGMRGA